MGCEQSTPVERRNNLGVGDTERQISKLKRAASSNENGDDGKLLPKLNEQGYLTAEEVAKRTFSSICNQEATLGTPSNVTHVQLAHWTQRGYYPDDPLKENQDAFGVHMQFAGVNRDAMFAVYDGHGHHGHSCAQFARDRLPKAIAKHVRKIRCQNYQKACAAAGKKGGWDPDKWPMLTRSEYESCCQKAFLEVNQAMHEAPNVVDTLSGTTAVTVNFHGQFASICNVGDSRVILGHRVKGSGKDISIHIPDEGASRSLSYCGEEEKNDIDDEIELETTRSAVASPVIEPGSSFSTRNKAAPGTFVAAIPLTKDQTPYRKDERERVKALGASVMSIDQMQGKEEMHEDWGDLVLGETIDIEGDSPRVWASGKDYPGCAFTRSLGDSMSKSIGVTAVPEILSTELTQNDEYLVVASDGIFEFLTNQTVIDLCEASESPLVACEKIVKASYEQWLTYEDRTDDITIVVCFLQNFTPPIVGGTEGTTEDLVASMASIYGTASKRMPPPPESVLAITRSTDKPPMEVTIQKETEAVAYVSEEAQAALVKDDDAPLHQVSSSVEASSNTKYPNSSKVSPHCNIKSGEKIRSLNASTMQQNLIVILAVLLLVTPITVTAQKFEPYQLNGGLVSAVAGKNFVVIASDTRFMGEGGYDILSRDHLESRLWLAGGGDKSLKTSTKRSFVLPAAPAFVGSAGCNADCEALKRDIQQDLRSATYFGECRPYPPVDQVATLLSQVLYSRRTFPYYAFCVVAGMDKDHHGCVFVYDAIGSYEQVAVACAGTGRELLQPILDRKFRTLITSSNAPIATTVQTLVDVGPEEAISVLVDGYRSVSEREIGVGDSVVICVARKGEEGQVTCTVHKVPLKTH